MTGPVPAPYRVVVGEASDPSTPFWHKPGQAFPFWTLLEANRYARIIRGRGWKATVKREEHAP